MPRLHEVQTGFSDSLFDESARNEIETLIRANKLTGARRLQVYRNNVFASLTEALRATHPVVDKLVGEGFFAYAANEFIKGHPSRSGDLHHFGSEFSVFLEAFEPAQELPYLPDVAKLEWFYHQVYHAADHAALALDRLTSVSPEQYAVLQFITHPAMRLLRSEYPVLKIWQVNQDEYDGDQTVDLDQGGIDVMLIRPDIEIEFHPLTGGQYEFLQVITQQGTLDTAAQAAMAANADFDLDESLTRFVQTRVLVDFSFRVAESVEPVKN